MNILYQCNDKYAPYCGVSVTSLFENNKDAESICVFILDDGISDENKKLFDLLSKQYKREIVFIATDSLIGKMKELNIPTYRGSYTANYKMFVNEFIPDDVDRIVYIDSDTVVSGSLLELFTIDLCGKPLAMAQDSLVCDYKLIIGMDAEDRYFNAGVLLFDLKEWKNQKCTEKIVEHTKTVRSHYSAPDQDLININIRKDIFMLSPIYNMEPAYFMFSLKNYYKVFKNDCFYPLEELENAKSDVRIYHFFRVMGEFPWHKNNMHPFNDLFDKYLEISPWADYEKLESNMPFVFKIEKKMYKYFPESIFIRLFRLSHKMFMENSNKLSLKNENNELM